MKKFSFFMALSILFIFCFCGLFAEIIMPHDPNEINLRNRLALPSADHLLGTDHIGRDMLSRLIAGSRSSVFIAVAATGCTLLLGMALGMISGYFGGMTDQIIQGIVNVFQGIPNTAIVVAVLGVMGSGLESMMLAIVVGSWAGFSRVVRNHVLELRELHYVEGARAMGASGFYIIWRHLLPNIIMPLLVLIASRIGSTVLTVAAMSFLGLGLRPPASDWGIMINDAKLYYMENFMVILAPALCITLFCLSVNLIADYLRDHMDREEIAAGIL